MPQKVNIILCSSNLLEFESSKKIQGFFEKNAYDDIKGFGTQAIEKSGNNLSIDLIKRVSTYIYEYNSLSKLLERRQIFVFQDIKFTLDLSSGIICVFGGGTTFNALGGILQKMFDQAILLVPLFTSPYSVYASIEASDIKYRLEQVSIEGFVFEESLSGKFNAEVIKPQKAKKVISAYQTDVKKLILLLNVDGEDEFRLQLGRGGVIGISGDEDYFDDSLQTIKELIAVNNG